MKILKAGLCAALIGLSASAAAVSLTCKGVMFNPITINWNNALPITIAGVQTGIGSIPAKMRSMPSVCYCKYVGPVPVPGIGITYWEPLFLAEVTNMPGCLSSMGGISMLSDSMTLHVQSTNEQGGKNHTNRQGGDDLKNMQVHWIQYPAFAMINAFSSLGCRSSAGFAVAGITEINPLWQEESLSNIVYPLTMLVSSMPAQMTCIADSFAAMFNQPIDELFWCMGSQGTIYPITGWAHQQDAGDADSNLLLLGKYMQGQAQLGGILTTIGPQSICASTYMPYMTRSQFRIEPIQPVPTVQTAVMGKPVMFWGMSPPLNPATRIDNNFLIWQGKQCCI